MYSSLPVLHTSYNSTSLHLQRTSRSSYFYITTSVRHQHLRTLCFPLVTRVAHLQSSIPTMTLRLYATAHLLGLQSSVSQLFHVHTTVTRLKYFIPFITLSLRSIMAPCIHNSILPSQHRGCRFEELHTFHIHMPVELLQCSIVLYLHVVTIACSFKELIPTYLPDVTHAIAPDLRTSILSHLHDFTIAT